MNVEFRKVLRKTSFQNPQLYHLRCILSIVTSCTEVRTFQSCVGHKQTFISFTCVALSETDVKSAQLAQLKEGNLNLWSLVDVKVYLLDSQCHILVFFFLKSSSSTCKTLSLYCCKLFRIHQGNE